jgi:hypothetical protein
MVVVMLPQRNGGVSPSRNGELEFEFEWRNRHHYAFTRNRTALIELYHLYQACPRPPHHRGRPSSSNWLLPWVCLCNTQLLSPVPHQTMRQSFLRPSQGRRLLRRKCAPSSASKSSSSAFIRIRAALISGLLLAVCCWSGIWTQ